MANQLFNVLAYLAFGIVLIILQSALLPLIHVGEVRIEFLLVVLAYMALFHPLVGGSFLAVALGYIYDLNSATPLGLHMLTFISCFLVVNLMRSRLYIQGPAFCIGLCSVFVVLHEIALYFFLTSRGHANWPPLSQIALVIPKALLTGALWPFITPVLRRIDAWFPIPVQGRRLQPRLEFRG